MMSVLAKIEAGDYDTKLPYPEKPKKPIKSGTNADSTAFINYGHELALWESKDAEYLEARRIWVADQTRLEGEFRDDLLIELGLAARLPDGQVQVTHPKAALLFNKAWDRGHSSGFVEVFHAAQDLAELLV